MHAIRRLGPPRPLRAAVCLALALSACGPGRESAVHTLELDQGWRLRGAADTAWIPATVPGTVHTDLLAAGRIPDPFRGDQEGELRWIEEEAWTYRLDFHADARLLSQERVELVFEGLDTWAEVVLNGASVIRADNMFRTWRADVAGTLREGANTLEVRFDPPVARGAERAAAHPWPIPHQEPDALGTRAFSRKAAYHFGWDWGPRFVTSGIWRPVRLEAWSGVRIVDATVLDVAWQGEAEARVRVRVELEAAGPEGRGRPTLGIRSPEDAFDPLVLRLPILPPDSSVTVDTTVVFSRARAWWPRGMGRTPGDLHTLDVDVVQDVPRDAAAEREASRRWDRKTLRVGLRTVELVTRADSVGESFLFRVNGEPVFARGANVVPPDHFTPRADSAAYARLIGDAVAANMNMLRVWGGGVYLPDVFYDLADEAGILVWQDFMFANALVPEDPNFASSVAAEALDQVRRLRRHPSVALWCGNNEIAEGWANWGWRDAYAPEVAERVETAMTRIFTWILPAVVAEHDPSRAYWTSSPSVGWGRPESLLRGDSHYWGVWWGMEPFRVYAEKVPRFASEYGFQALPDPVSMAAFFPDGGAATGSLRHPSMRAHQKHPTGYETIRTYVGRDWPVPPDDSLDAWSYVSQLAQSEGVGLALEAHRRSWPHTGGTLYWQLNDTWPVVSWSSRDHFGRWKALHWKARRVFAPVAVLADAWADTVAVWVATDGGAEVPGAATLTVRAVDFQGRVLSSRTAAVPLDAERSVAAWRGTSADLLPDGADPRDVVVEARLEGPGGTLGVDHAFLVPPSRLRLTDPEVRVLSVEPAEDPDARVGRGGPPWRVTLAAARLAYGVRLSLDGTGARFSDNFFHLLPGDTVTVTVQPEAPLPDLRAGLRIRTLHALR